MIEPKLSFTTELIDKEDERINSPGLRSSSKKEPKMHWDSKTQEISSAVEEIGDPPVKSVDWKEYVVPEMNEKESLLKELLQEKDKRIAALTEIIDLQKKLIEQLQK